MSQESACGASTRLRRRIPQYVVADGKLGNVFVYVKSGLPAGAKQAAATAVEIDQSG